MYREYIGEFAGLPLMGKRVNGAIQEYHRRGKGVHWVK